MTNVIIIEDDSKVAFELKEMIEQTGSDFKVCSILHTVLDARVWLMSNKAPQLIFCDIQLADGLGFEIFRNLPISAPVIFSTSYDEYALKAFENNGIDYLLKPIDNARLQKKPQEICTAKRTLWRR